ncbi:uncharacterized protein BDW70DRAFT_128979 [Aspergillus foveolatus]|uniref:uncharacterized protein n=1 Tax=Aspergillus foveolatus TaxID=210207 RepID=UPI003CCD8F9B
MSLGSVLSFMLILSLASRRNAFPLRARGVATTEAHLGSKACYCKVDTKPLLVDPCSIEYWETVTRLVSHLCKPNWHSTSSGLS